MRKHNKEKIIVEKDILIAIICDNCSEDIKNNEKDHFFEVMTSHSDWGNDSRDSIRHFDFCGPRCIAEHSAAYFEKANGSEEYNAERVEKSEVLRNE